MRIQLVSARLLAVCACAAAVLLAGPASAQEAAPSGPAVTLCGQAVPPPANLPPAGSGPVVYFLAPCFEKQGGASVIEAQTYLYYIQLRPSRPSANVWIPYNEDTEQTVLGDFNRLWATNFLDDLSIEVTDYTFSNGVIGKLVAYNMEERQRIKVVNYTGTKEVDQTKIDERLRELNVAIRLDSFIDQGLVRRVSGIVRAMMAEKGFQDATVEPVIEPIAGGPKLVHLEFRITEGPKVRLAGVDFVGAQAFSSGTLRRRMKQNKGPGLMRFIGRGGGVYQEDRFAEDAEQIVAFYRERGYIEVRVGQPELKHLRDSSDGKTRWMQLQVPVTEGRRYRLGEFSFDGNKKVSSEILRPLFKLQKGEIYNEKVVREGLDRSREIYGAGGHFEFTGFPDLQPATPTDPGEAAATGDPIVNVTMRMQEGEQYFVNRITFLGNTTTRDNVIRREMRLVENGVFDTESLKYSVRRLNQLGYFKPLEDQRNIAVEKTAGATNKVDVSLKLEEQNRNQLSFGAGVSQYDGFFGQLSFQTSNFMGRGESLTLSLQAGARASDYQIAFSEPFLFNRPITGAVDVHRRAIRYPEQFTQQSVGGNATVGYPLADFTRMFFNYSLERVKITDLNELYLNPQLLAFNPFLQDSLLIGQDGHRTISKVTPTVTMNTVDNPVTPVTGRRYTASFAVAGLGGDTRFLKPTLEGVWFLRHTGRTSLGLRAQFEYIRPLSDSDILPIFERLFLGGGYSVRGFDLRSIGPRDPVTGLVIGGNKSTLFNAEYLITIAGPVRLILFYDAGQVKNVGQVFSTSSFATSTGAEIRFFMPVLNVPFRLIFAANPQREGVLDNTLQPEKAFRFRFDVGSTF